MRGRTVRWALAALGLAVVAVGAVACGSSGNGTDAGDTGTGGGGGFQAYVDCLARNGISVGSFGPGGRPSRFPSGFPSGGPASRFPSGGAGQAAGGFLGDQPPAGVDQQTWDRARQACASVRPTFGAGGGNSAFTAYRNCLSDHGVTLTGGPNQLNTADPKVAAAQKACEALRPSGPRSP
jgi:hypothetical protein